MLLQLVKGQITTQSSSGKKKTVGFLLNAIFLFAKEMKLTWSDQVQPSEPQAALELSVLFFVQSQIALAYFCFQ